jgi:hypothetical protein
MYIYIYVFIYLYYYCMILYVEVLQNELPEDSDKEPAIWVHCTTPTSIINKGYIII